MQLNTKTQSGRTAALLEVKRLIEKGTTLEIKEIVKTRSTIQNRALHLYFKQIAEALNDAGLYYTYQTGITNNSFEIQWDGELVKERIWKPLQKVLTKKTSTTKLNKNEIDPIYDVINKSLSDRGLTVSFPNKFDCYLDSID